MGHVGEDGNLTRRGAGMEAVKGWVGGAGREFGRDGELSGEEARE